MVCGDEIRQQESMKVVKRDQKELTFGKEFDIQRIEAEPVPADFLGPPINNIKPFEREY